jgi:hypothetical protein
MKMPPEILHYMKRDSRDIVPALWRSHPSYRQDEVDYVLSSSCQLVLISAHTDNVRMRLADVLEERFKVCMIVV